MSVSVILTVKNEAATLPHLLDSLMHQSLWADEIVVCDGGSSDETLDILTLYQQWLPIKIISAPGANISEGRNRAIAAATGEVIAGTDGGVVLSPDWLRELVRPIEERNVSVVSGWFEADPYTDFEVVLGATVLPDRDDINPTDFLPSSRSIAFQKAAWAAAGWRIEHTEVPTDQHQHAELLVDGQPMQLTGRIDRIDVHSATGERMVFDYKTSDASKRPEDAHQQRGEWIDLQLPLYRHLVRALGIEGPVRLGYITLSKDTSRIDFLEATWSETDLEQADLLAHEIIRSVRGEQFWPPTDPPPDFSEDFAAICQDRVFAK